MESILYLNATNRDSFRNERHTWRLEPSATNIGSNYELEVLQVQFNHVLLPTNSNNNQIWFQETNTAQTIKIATVPVGSYVPSTYATALGVAMTAASGIGATYTVTYDTLTQRFTVSSTGTFRFYDAAVFPTAAPSTIPSILVRPSTWQQVGMSLSNDSSLFSTFSSSKTSSVSIDISGPKSVYLEVQTLQQGDVVAAIAHRQLILNVPLPQFGEIVQYEMQTPMRLSIRGMNLPLIRIDMWDSTHFPFILSDVQDLELVVRLTRV